MRGGRRFDQRGEARRHWDGALVVLLLARSDQLAFVGREAEAERVAVEVRALQGEELAEAQSGQSRGQQQRLIVVGR